MQDYLYRVFVIVLIAGVATMLNTKSKAHASLTFAVSLCVISVLLSPLSEREGSLFSPISDIFSDEGDTYDYESGEWLNVQIEDTVERTLEREIAGRFSISDGEIAVDAETENTDNGIIIVKVTVRLDGSAARADIPGIVTYVEKNCGAECEVFQNGK